MIIGIQSQSSVRGYYALVGRVRYERNDRHHGIDPIPACLILGSHRVSKHSSLETYVKKYMYPESFPIRNVR